MILISIGLVTFNRFLGSEPLNFIFGFIPWIRFITIHFYFFYFNSVWNSDFINITICVYWDRVKEDERTTSRTSTSGGTGGSGSSGGSGGSTTGGTGTTGGGTGGTGKPVTGKPGTGGKPKPSSGNTRSAAVSLILVLVLSCISLL